MVVVLMRGAIVFAAVTILLTAAASSEVLSELPFTTTRYNTIF
jgi:hypothetical protein